MFQFAAYRVEEGRERMTMEYIRDQHLDPPNPPERAKCAMCGEVYTRPGRRKGKGVEDEIL